MDETPEKLALGPGRAINHKSETQATGWKKEWEEALSAYNRSPLAVGNQVNPLDFGRKLTGLLTDHAADQQKLARLLCAWKIECDREMRGHQAVLTTPLEELVALVTGENEKMMERAGGLGKWGQLAPEIRDELANDVFRQCRIMLGKEAYDALSDDEKRLADLFIWSGCGMHKDLNAVKGGCTRMAAVWVTKGVEPPISLLNRDKAAARLANPALSKLTNEQETDSERGAVKLAQLVGALVNHKDDKKGYHNLFRHFCHSVIHQEVNFPDTSNTRYQCYCNAATELITHQDLYLEFLAFLEHYKTKSGLNHLERNVLAGLMDPPTRTELAVLSLYSQTVSIPYIRYIRGSTANHLDLAPFHDQLKQHCRKVIEDPEILIGNNVSWETATLDSKPWQNEEAVNTIHSSQDKLPNLQEALVLFFEGALETWERFTPEFQPDSEAMLATPEERAYAWRPSTNDDNESGCARVRTLLRIAPNMTELQLKARVVGEVNRTDEWMAENFDEDGKLGQYIRTETRRLDEGRHHQLQNTVTIEAGIQGSKERREKKEKREEAMQKKRAEMLKSLDGFEPVFDLIRLRSMERREDTIARMKLQLAWHREIGKDSQVPEHLSKLKLWADVREKLVEVVERHLEAGAGRVSGVGVAQVRLLRIPNEFRLTYRINRMVAITLRILMQAHQMPQLQGQPRISNNQMPLHQLHCLTSAPQETTAVFGTGPTIHAPLTLCSW